MAGAVALFSAMDALLKLLVERYPPMQVTTLRGLASLPFLLLPFLIRGRWHRLSTGRWHCSCATVGRGPAAASGWEAANRCWLCRC